MEEKSMTALVSSFARWYHSKNNDTKIFDDFLADKILTDEEKQQISFSMSKGIGFFNPSFQGTDEEALRWIVDNQLSPTTLGRAAWAEKALNAAVKDGVRQYLIIAAGYDTFAYREQEWANDLQIIELDYPQMSEDKKERVKRISEQKPNNLTYVPIDLTTQRLFERLNSCNVFDKSKLSFFSLLGISYYLSKEDFRTLLKGVADSATKGSIIVFDYPDEYTYTEQAGERTKKQSMLASGVNEEMLAGYSYQEISSILSDCDFSVCEHLTPTEMTKQYFGEYNSANPTHLITAFDNVNYCLAVKSILK